MDAVAFSTQNCFGMNPLSIFMFRHDFTAKYKSIVRKVYNKEGLNYCCTAHTEDGLHYHNYSIPCLRHVGETSFLGNVNYWWGSIVLTWGRMPSVNGALRSGNECACRY
jgi:hypothetical protein